MKHSNNPLTQDEAECLARLLNHSELVVCKYACNGDESFAILYKRENGEHVRTGADAYRHSDTYLLDDLKNYVLLCFREIGSL